MGNIFVLKSVLYRFKSFCGFNSPLRFELKRFVRFSDRLFNVSDFPVIELLFLLHRDFIKDSFEKGNKYIEDTSLEPFFNPLISFFIR